MNSSSSKSSSELFHSTACAVFLRSSNEVFLSAEFAAELVAEVGLDCGVVDFELDVELTFFGALRRASERGSLPCALAI